MANNVTHDPFTAPDAVDVIDVQLQGTGLDLDATGASNLHSIDPNGIAQNRTEIVIINWSASAATLKHDSASGTAGMRLRFHDGLDHTLATQQQVWGQRIDDARGQFWLMEIPG